MEIIEMRSYRSLIYVVALALGLAASIAPAKAVVLDWDTVAWNPGSLNNSYDVTGDGINDITVALSSQNANVWTNDPTTGTMTPTINQTMTGGLSPVENSLLLAANLHTNSNVTLHLSFTGAQPGATNVSFTIFDIDVTTNSDIVEGIFGFTTDGTWVPATITNVGPAVTLSGTGFGQTLTGDVPSPNNSSNGNVTISFGAAYISDIFLTFSNTAGAPRYQDIAIGDISFTPVPEVDPAIASAISCFLAIGLTVFLRRRAALRHSAR
ncbi:MAG: hypothetical protein V7609_1867 [Verrucomicrobiota bacterium]